MNKIAWIITLLVFGGFGIAGGQYVRLGKTYWIQKPDDVLANGTSIKAHQERCTVETLRRLMQLNESASKPSIEEAETDQIVDDAELEIKKVIEKTAIAIQQFTVFLEAVKDAMRLRELRLTELRLEWQAAEREHKDLSVEIEALQLTHHQRQQSEVRRVVQARARPTCESAQRPQVYYRCRLIPGRR